MKGARLLLFALAGLALPVGLALGVYAASAGPLTAVPAVIEAPPEVARGTSTGEAPTTTAPPRTTTAGDDDLPGKCRKPENRLDPDCDPRTADPDDDDDSSGPGSGGDDDSSGSGSSGSGSDDDSSGPGSGDDD